MKLAHAFGIVFALSLAIGCGDDGGGNRDDGNVADDAGASEDGTATDDGSTQDEGTGADADADGDGDGDGDADDAPSDEGGGDDGGGPTWNATYYVRVDGGTADQCDGTADAAYPGSGTGLACAWIHPFIALPPGGTARIAGGDRLVIGPGDYRMGYGAPGDDACDESYTYDCTSAAVPSGTDAGHPTWIVGEGYDAGCDSPPELWGTERAWQVLDLTDASHVRVECLEITDRSGCVEFHSGSIQCVRDTYPHGDWASTGLIASDSTDVTLRNLDIHGLAHTGVYAGRLADWTVENVRIAGNGWVGWDGDIDGDDSNSGTMRFTGWTVEWNGCGETWPGREPTGCWGQSAGGYGDGVGTGATGGDWIIERSSFLHNTSDGLDLLYHSGGGTITLDGVVAKDNAGNQVKTRGPVTIRNSVVVGNCAFFEGKAFTMDVDPCRAAGNALSLTLGAGDTVVLANNTIWSEGDCVVLLGDGGCDGSETIRWRNNLFLGAPDWTAGGSEDSCFWYSECPSTAPDQDYDLIFGTKDDHPCPSGANDLCVDPRIGDATPETFNATLQVGSPARDSGAPVGGDVPATDINGAPRPRGTGVDRGAYEM